MTWTLLQLPSAGKLMLEARGKPLSPFYCHLLLVATEHVKTWILVSTSHFHRMTHGWLQWAPRNYHALNLNVPRPFVDRVKHRQSSGKSHTGNRYKQLHKVPMKAAHR